MEKVLHPFVSHFNGKSKLKSAEFIKIFRIYDKDGKILYFLITFQGHGKEKLWHDKNSWRTVFFHV